MCVDYFMLCIKETTMRHYKYDISAFGEILIDFTYVGNSANGQKLFAQNPGGAPANVLVCAEKLGSNTAFIGKAGQDMHGTFLKETLEKENVDTEGFILDENFFTTLAFVDLNEDGERTFSFGRKPGADTQMKAVDMNLDIINGSKIFHVGSLSLTHEPARSATFFALEKARKNGVIISYDPNYRASLWSNVEVAKEQMQRIIPDIMKISDEETALLTSQSDYKLAAKELFEKGVEIVVVTIGSEGAYVYNKDGGQVVKGFRSSVVDTTGAGDAFWGGFLHQIAQSEKPLHELSLEEISIFAKFANAVASICVEDNGAIPAMPKLENVMERLGRD